MTSEGVPVGIRPLPACGERWSMRLRRCGSLPAAGSLRARLWPAEDRAEAPVDADLHGVDVREAGVEAEGAARHHRAIGEGCGAAAHPILVAQPDPHVLGLDAPVR